MVDVRVVMQSLLDAQHGVTAVMDELAEQDVDDLAADPAAFGHDGLGAVTREFCERWAYGVANLTDDGNALAAGLGSTVRQYAETDHLNVVEFR